ncbi:MAG: helix-turn-helix domain-containing protein [Tannerellaceae bacterium]|nr:helix-turn-helix domain-containing protein [Tannerellaceae bacterium]
MEYNKILDRLKQSIAARYPEERSFSQRFSELLGVSQKTINNKLSGKNQFLVEEMFRILEYLKIPLSEVMDDFPGEARYPMELLANPTMDMKGSYSMLDWCYGKLTAGVRSENSTLLIASSIIPETVLLDCQWLPAFSMLKWMFYNKGYNARVPLPEIIRLRTHNDKRALLRKAVSELSKTEYILNSNLTQNLVSEILSFYDYGIVTLEDIRNMTEELTLLLERLEQVCSDGIVPDSDKEIQIYSCTTDIQSNIYLLKSDAVNVGLIYSNYLNPVVSKHENTFNQMESWFSSIKRLSNPISQTGIKNRIDFISEQKRALQFLAGKVGG